MCCRLPATFYRGIIQSNPLSSWKFKQIWSCPMTLFSAFGQISFPYKLNNFIDSFMFPKECFQFLFIHRWKLLWSAGREPARNWNCHVISLIGLIWLFMIIERLGIERPLHRIGMYESPPSDGIDPLKRGQRIPAVLIDDSASTIFQFHPK